MFVGWRMAITQNKRLHTKVCEEFGRVPAFMVGSKAPVSTSRTNDHRGPWGLSFGWGPPNCDGRGIRFTGPLSHGGTLGPKWQSFRPLIQGIDLLGWGKNLEKK